jgi:cytochrome c
MRKLAYLTCTLTLAVGSPSFAADAAKGKEVFEQCSVCHNADSDEKKMGPGLKGLYKRKLSSGKQSDDASVGAKINEGGGGMPGYADTLTTAEKADLLTYLKTL